MIAAMVHKTAEQKHLSVYEPRFDKRYFVLSKDDR